MRYVALLMLLVSCDDWDPFVSEGDADTDVDADTDTDVDPIDPDPPSPGTWSVFAHPCVGDRTDTMLVEGNTIWVGCGTTYDGRGLWRSTNAGSTWSMVAPTVLDSWRINDIFRADDGYLYLAGVDVDGDGRGARYDGSDVEILFENTGLLWTSMVTGSVRATASGDIVFESLNGSGVAYREGGTNVFTEASEWWANGETKQILDLEILEEDFYGCGSTIGSPPVVFLPLTREREGFEMRQLELTEDFDGELWDIVVDGDGILAVGADQDDDIGTIFTSRSTSPFDASEFSLYKADAHYSTTTWFRGACRRGSTAYAVGELSTSGDGFMVGSDNGGFSWYPIPLPADTRGVHVCHIDSDGTVHVAGAEGFYGRYEP